MSGLDEQLADEIGGAEDCYTGCKAEHGYALVAVDWWSDDNPCYCADDCTCMDEVGMLVSTGRGADSTECNVAAETWAGTVMERSSAWYTALSFVAGAIVCSVEELRVVKTRRAVT
jgi:hypothetical protein